MTEDETPLENLKRDARVESRQFHRVFSSPDGKAVLASLKRDFGWDAAHPPLVNGDVSDHAMRSWIGVRAVIATIIERSESGKKLSYDNQPTVTNDENEH